MFSTYALTTQPLKATVTFVTLSLFNTLRFPLVMIPKALKINIEGYKARSCSRLYARESSIL